MFTKLVFVWLAAAVLSVVATTGCSHAGFNHYNADSAYSRIGGR